MAEKTIYLCDGCSKDLGELHHNWTVGRVVLLDKTDDIPRNPARITTNSDKTAMVVGVRGPYRSDPAGGHGEYDYIHLEFCAACARRLLATLEKLAHKKAKRTPSPRP